MTDALDLDVRAEIYRSFIDAGIPPTAATVAARLGTSPADVIASFERLDADHVISLLPGSTYIWMANPFSAVPTDFTVRAGGARWWGNCIWDALGILGGLGIDGTVSSWCPDCGEAIEVVVENGAVSSEATSVHFSVPAAKWWEDIGHT